MKNQTSDPNRLRAWYEDSLGLLEVDKTRASRGASVAQEPRDNPTIGILYLNSTGQEVWGFGNLHICRELGALIQADDPDEKQARMHAFGNNTVLYSQIKNTRRIIVITRAFLLRMLGEIYPAAELSDAELHLMVQILCGNSLKEAADIDGVAYETKRSQFKSLASKTDTHSQSEVVRITLATLLSYILDAVGVEAARTGSTVVDEKVFLDLYYPDTFRFHEISLEGGRTLRVADAGPVLGKPVVFVHSQTLPPPSQVKPSWLAASNTRLLIPLRHGFMQGTVQPDTAPVHLHRSAQDIADTIRLLCNGSARLVSQSTGVAYGLRAAMDAPELVEEYTIAAAAHLGDYTSGKVHKFVSAMKKLASSNNLVLEKTYDQYLRRMSTPAGFRKLLQSTYKNSEIDVQTFNDIIDNPLIYSWIFETYRLSRWSVIRDVTLGNLDIWAGVDSLKCRVTFVHGAFDPINPLDAAKAVSERFANSTFIELEDRGQSLFLTCFEELVTRDADAWKDNVAKIRKKALSKKIH
ncbi:alpha/beta fold hydrolase [Salaquimonas pukyongi]|uniref:alpha/beta fold hydrolase n=1 Tax=Salaquimonas pukyongi TaxID=2712698 RepID=UPI00096B7CA3|nr:alpha/beta hydrolase [Salaquimonas pukyongi]